MQLCSGTLILKLIQLCNCPDKLTIKINIIIEEAKLLLLGPWTVTWYLRLCRLHAVIHVTLLSASVNLNVQAGQIEPSNCNSIKSTCMLIKHLVQRKGSRNQTHAKSITFATVRSQLSTIIQEFKAILLLLLLLLLFPQGRLPHQPRLVLTGNHKFK